MIDDRWAMANLDADVFASALALARFQERADLDPTRRGDRRGKGERRG